MTLTSRIQATHPSGGFSASDLDHALHETLDALQISSADLMAVGWTPNDLARTLAATAPFSDALLRQIRERLGS